MNENYDEYFKSLKKKDDFIASKVKQARNDKIEPQFTPTGHQREVLDKINYWLNIDRYSKLNIEKSLNISVTETDIDEANINKGYLFGILEGGAGVGKTSLVDSIIAEYDYPARLIDVVAPTHKALAALRGKIKNTGVNFKTTAKLLGLRPDLDISNFDPSEPMFKTNGSTDSASTKLILHDECSMLNSKLMETLIEVVMRDNIKILLIGDRVQLPPVNEKLSNSFIIPKHLFSLTEIIRQNNSNPLLQLLHLFREDIENGIYRKENTNKWFEFIKQNHSMINEHGGFKCMKESTFNDTLKDNFQKDYMNCRMYCYTNKSVSKYNNIIHDYLGFQRKLNEGEILLSYSTIEGKLINSNEYEVLERKECKQEFIRLELNKRDIKLSYLKKPVSSLKNNIVSITGCLLTIKDLHSGENKKIFVVDEKDYKKIVDNHFSFFNKHGKGFVNYVARSMYPAYKEFDVLNLLSTDVYYSPTIDRTSPNWAKGYFKIKSKHLDLGYAMTIHKSQGSTVENVFVDIAEILLFNKIQKNNFYKNHKRAMTEEDELQIDLDSKKLMYVGISRSSKYAYLKMK